MSLRLFWIHACLLSAISAPSLGAELDATVLNKARSAAGIGRFREAEQILRTKIADLNAPITGPYAEQLEVLRRIRLDYSLSGAALLEKIKASIPDVTPEDLVRWQQQGMLQCREIDGKRWYFSSEPSNLFRFCAAAKQRRTDTRVPGRAGWKFALPAHLANIVRLAEQSSGPTLFPVRHHVTYRLTVDQSAPRLKPGAKVRCWLPYPQQYRQQTQVRLIATHPTRYQIAPNAYPQRTIYFEQVVKDVAKPLVFSVEYEFVTAAYYPKLDVQKVQPYDRQSQLYLDFTAERSPHIVFTPKIRDIVERVAADEPNPLLRAIRLFRWMDQNIRYCSEMEYSTIPNISDKAISSRRGDCGVQSLLFITLCRAAGIPARWQSGWETKPNGRNMHDWAEFYVEPWGWLPADPSYGLQQHTDPRVREFYCGHLDPYRMIVNLDYARELTPQKTSFRSEPNDFQRGEVEIDGHNLYFDQWTWTCDVDTVPLTNDFIAVQEGLDSVVPKHLIAGNVPGAVILVGQRGAAGYQTWQKAYGYKQVQPNPQPMATDTIFDLASMTKPIATGTSLMLLADAGLLDPDDSVGKYLPEFGEGEKQHVTIRHLMTHMSGERPYVGASDQKKIIAASGFPCPAATRAFIRKLALVRKPSAAMQYSCLNAICCEEILRRVTGTELNEFAQRNIFQPLGMNDTGFLPPPCRDQRLAPTEHASYGRGAGGFLLGQVHDPLAAMQGGVSGNAGLFSTAADLSRFAQMMMNGGQLDGIRILQPETVRRMTSVQNPGGVNTSGKPDRRGLLWDIYQPDPGDQGVDTIFAFGHTGYTGTAIRCHPSKGVYIIALTNRVHPDDSGKVSVLRAAVWRTVGEAILGIRPAGTTR